MQELVKNEPGIVLLRSVENLTNVWKKAKLSVSMGGYNTLMEVICSRIPALIIPYCNESNSEQEIRAIKLQKEGLVETTDFEKSHCRKNEALYMKHTLYMCIYIYIFLYICIYIYIY